MKINVFYALGKMIVSKYKTGLKTIMVLLVFFNTIVPVYANTMMPTLKDLFGNSQLAVESKHTVPCHREIQKASSFSNMQELCFQHCLQYLNEPCIISHKADALDIVGTQKQYKSILVSLQRLPQVQYEISSQTDPPESHLLVRSKKGLTSTLLLTSRLRN